MMKIAIITGGSRGLGQSMSLRLAEKGHDIFLTYTSKKAEADAVVAQIEKMNRKAVALQLDAADHKSFKAFAENVKNALKDKWQRNDFDFLVNNAGIGIHATFMETTEEQFDQLMNIQRKLIGWHDELQDAARFPMWQFKDGALLGGLEEVLVALNAGNLLDDIGRILFFVSNHGCLGGERPLDRLRAGDVNEVLRAAAGYVS